MKKKLLACVVGLVILVGALGSCGDDKSKVDSAETVKVEQQEVKEETDKTEVKEDKETKPFNTKEEFITYQKTLLDMNASKCLNCEYEIRCDGDVIGLIVFDKGVTDVLGYAVADKEEFFNNSKSVKAYNDLTDSFEELSKVANVENEFGVSTGIFVGNYYNHDNILMSFYDGEMFYSVLEQ